MKILGLSVFLIVCVTVCLAGACYAQDADNQASPPVKLVTSDSDWLAAPVAGGAADRLILNLNSDQPNSLNNSCATMRTYRVKRRSRGSEAVGPAGYTTCVPMRRFEVHNAVETQTDSGARILP